MSVHHMHTCYRGSQKGISHPLGLKLHMVVKHHVGAGNLTVGSLKEQQVILPADQCLQSNP